MNDTQEPTYVEETDPEQTGMVVPHGAMIVEKQQDPTKVIEMAQKAAKELSKIVESSGLAIAIPGNDKKFLQYEAWQLLGRFNNATPRISWTRRLVETEGGLNLFRGYEAKAEIVQNGMIIASAEAMCLTEERNWSNKPEFQLRSMAQTRAAAKALRMCFSWVVVLAGYAPTPSEEITGEEGASVVTATTLEHPDGICPKCGSPLKKVPAGVSKKTGNPYPSFIACSNRDCTFKPTRN